MEKRQFFSERAPKPRGCYSQAIILGNTLYSAGQLPVDPDSGEIVRGSVAEQVTQIMENIKSLLEDAGSSLENVVKATVFLRNVSLWDDVNRVYSSYFQDMVPPARTVASGIDIHYGLDVEMEIIAYVPSSSGKEE